MFETANDVYEDINNSYNSNDLDLKPAKFVGGTTVSVYNAIETYSSIIENSDLIVMLGCEGNIDESYIEHFRN